MKISLNGQKMNGDDVYEIIKEMLPDLERELRKDIKEELERDYEE